MADQTKLTESAEFDESQYISISQFFNGKSVFITGATGFLGKMLVEKLLRSCSEIGNIYLLVRPKTNNTVYERLETILNSKIFESIKLHRAKDLDKIKVISGDLTSDELGLSPKDQEILIKEVSAVFHSAATIRFDEPLKTAIDINMIGTRKIINLCKKMEILQTLVYISTAYSNCDQKNIGENIYSQSYSPKDIETMCNIIPEEILNKITPFILDKKPNSYTLTKALTEEIILNEALGLPLAIIRPSIIGASYKEPFPGWIDNFAGPASLMYAIGNGFMRAIRINANMIADIIPADIVVNLTIVAAWKTAMDKSMNMKLSVYNCVSGQQNPIMWKTLLKSTITYMREYPLEDALWYIFLIKINCDKTFKWMSYILHYVPALLIDFYIKCLGKRPIMMKVKKRIDRVNDQLKFFITNQWSFNDRNVRNLLHKMSINDRNIFQIDTNVIEWDLYVKIYCIGVRKYLLKQNTNSLVNSRKQMKRLYYYHHMSIICIFAAYMYYIFVYILY